MRVSAPFFLYKNPRCNTDVRHDDPMLGKQAKVGYYLHWTPKFKWCVLLGVDSRTNTIKTYVSMSSNFLTDMGSIVNIIGKTYMIFCKEKIFSSLMNKIFLLVLRNYEDSLDLDLLVILS
jgi:hypothetical protein